MKLRVTLLQSSHSGPDWMNPLKQILSRLKPLQLDIEEKQEIEDLGQVIFLDSRRKDLSETLSKIDRRGRAVFLLAEESQDFPDELISGEADDVLVFPYRVAEVLGKLRTYQQILKWDEVQKLNQSFSELIGHLHEDLKLAERLQRRHFPQKFPTEGGIKVTSRYLAGMKAGGDYFDLIPGGKSDPLSLILTDSSSYGLSSAVLSTLMRVAARFSKASAGETIHALSQEIRSALGEKDQLSIFYGRLSPKDLKLRYLNLGSARAFYAPKKKGFKTLPVQGDPIAPEKKLPSWDEVEMSLDPESRLVLVSDGFLDLLGGASTIETFLSQYRDEDPEKTLTELLYQVKSKLDPDDFPDQDCSAVILEVDGKKLRLVS